jgi:hypothetical protein
MHYGLLTLVSTVPLYWYGEYRCQQAKQKEQFAKACSEQKYPKPVFEQVSLNVNENAYLKIQDLISNLKKIFENPSKALLEAKSQILKGRCCKCLSLTVLSYGAFSLHSLPLLAISGIACLVFHFKNQDFTLQQQFDQYQKLVETRKQLQTGKKALLKLA